MYTYLKQQYVIINILIEAINILKEYTAILIQEKIPYHNQMSNFQAMTNTGHYYKQCKLQQYDGKTIFAVNLIKNLLILLITGKNKRT